MVSVVRKSRFRILCVEDESAIRQDMAEVLREEGFDVEEADNGLAALAAVDRRLPHLIISDFQMPQMDGLKLLETLRARNDAAADIPFIFLTAFGDRESMLAGRREGADDYLVKPVDFDLMIAVAESHLVNARRRAARAAVTPASLGASHPLGGMRELLAALADADEGTPFAMVAVDNLLELLSRLGDPHSGHFTRFIRRLERMYGLRLFQLSPYKFVVLGRKGAPLEPVLIRLVTCPIRDRTQRGSGKVILTCSIVTERLAAGMVISDVLARMRMATRMLQRDGGSQMVTLRGPELETLRQAGAIRAELVDAIDQGQLTVRLQPKVDCRTLQLSGAEVLVRWQSPRLGTLSPNTFIPILERAGMLRHVTDWVLRKAAECQVELRRRGMPAHLAVNIGANEFTPDLPVRLATICNAFGADPALLELEITETTLMDDLAASAEVIDGLRAAGVRIALDDFGTGYSSLSYLAECRIDTLKIDRSFVIALASNEVNQKVVAGIIDIGDKLGVQVVAEGVETPNQREWLSANGCDVIQGYLVSQPLTPEEYYLFAARQPETCA